MFKNNLKIAWRNLEKNQLYSFINIAGLASGIAVALMIGLWIWDELSFDHYHLNHNSLAQVMDIQTINGVRNTSEAIAIPLADELRTKYASDFKYVAIVFPNFVHTLAVGDKKLSESGEWAQPDLPEMLTLNMLEGKRDALKDPSSVLLTASLAKALFGNEDPMNKTIRLDNMMVVKVGGVFEDLPLNTTFSNTKLFLSWDKAISSFGWLKEAQTQWDNRYWKLFVQLNDQADIRKVNAKIKDVTQKHTGESKEEIFLHPMDQWHLYSEFHDGKMAGGRIRYVWIFGIIGLSVVLLACINFMNLSTARSEKRAKEVGIRKAAGSLRGQLIGQFLAEAMLTSLFALAIALVIVQLALPFFNSLTEKQIALPYNNIEFWLIILGFTFLTGIVSGSYPAFYLSALKPIKVLKGNFRSGSFTSLPRKALVIVQFTSSIALIIGTIIIYRQIIHAKDRPVGYTREGLISVTMNTPEIFDAPYDALRNELMQTGAVMDMCESSGESTESPLDNTDFNWEGKDPGVEPLMGIVGVTHDFGHTIGWHIKDGRDFSRIFPADSGSLILNEAAAMMMGFQNPAGQTIQWKGRSHKVIGVVNDLVMESPYSPVKPTIFYLEYDWLNAITLRINPRLSSSLALAKIAQVFKKFNPGGSFDYHFTDEEYAQKFSDEERVGHLAAIFALLAILISCMGLFGLASFVADQRTKEIGIRKVLGASLFNLWGLLSKEFLMLMVISLLIAVPIAYFFMNSWLLHYQYRTAISWWIFALAGSIVLVMTLIIVSTQTIKAAMSNPVKNLRTE